MSLSPEAKAWLVVRAKYHYGEWNDVVVRELDRELENAGLYLNGFITPEGEDYLTRDEVVAEGVRTEERVYIHPAPGLYVTRSADGILPEGEPVQVIVRVIKEGE